jgi:hypothetical protein
MSIYVLDTSILVGYIYGSEYAEYIEAKYSIMQPNFCHYIFLSCHPGAGWNPVRLDNEQ